MCRLLGYLGETVLLDRLLYKPEHSLIVQSYQPREMTAGILNADGFGIGWYHPEKETNPYIYKNTSPIWNDVNLPHLSRYVESQCILAYVRSATPPASVDIGNCQPFTQDHLSFIHNGFINHFRDTLYRPIRHLLEDSIYNYITGTTDSEHIFALVLNELGKAEDISLKTALQRALEQLVSLSQSYDISFSANIVLSDGKKLVASRYAYNTSTPTLYWLRDDAMFPGAVILASEPLFGGNWNSCPPSSLISVQENLEVNIDVFS